MRNCFAKALASFLLLGGAAASVFGEVRDVRLKIDGYLCGN